jgi:ABC-type phosphate transport system substrate-binding protein
MRVSLPLTAHGGRIRAAAAALCAVAAMVVAAAATPPQAHASFTIGHCGGVEVEGQGSSAQKEAQLEFWSTTIFHEPEPAGGCGSSAPTVKYEPNGSGCGIASIGADVSAADCVGLKASESGPGVRSGSTRFAGSDAPLTATQQANADAAGGPKPGLIHQIPVAAFAVTIVVHFPEGCKLKDPGVGSPANGAGSANGDVSTGGPNDPPGGATGDSAAEETLRVHVSAAEMENIWDGRAQEWKDIVPVADMEEDTKSAKPATAAECGALPVIRIARFDGSGTTYNLKAYLSLLEATQGTSGLWTTAPLAGDNTNWPIGFGGEKKKPNPVNGSHVCEDATHICTAAQKGGGEVASAVEATNGSIGYVDLATARKKGFYMAKKADDHTYWIPMQTVSPEEGDAVGASYVEPTEVPTSDSSPSPEGANCTGADYRGYPAVSVSEPDPTLGNWEKAIAAGGTAAAIASAPTTAYPVCGLTYDFAFDDDAPVFGEGGEEQAKARTVKDYLEAVETELSQFHLAFHDYGTLPLSIIRIAQNGVKAIDWKKAAGSGGSKEEVKKTPPVEEKTVVATPITTPPSNAFSIAGAKVKGKAISLSLVLPGAGSVQIKAVGGGVTVSSVTASVSGGNGTVTLSISKAALKKLAKAKGHKLSVKITVTFTPTGGAAASKTKTLTITQAALGPKKKTTKGKKK